MRPLLGVGLGDGGELLMLLRFREILPLVPPDLEAAAPDSERDVEVRPEDVEVDVLGGVVFL
jgi:hypothetical protein